MRLILLLCWTYPALIFAQSTPPKEFASLLVTYMSSETWIRLTTETEMTLDIYYDPERMGNNRANRLNEGRRNLVAFGRFGRLLEGQPTSTHAVRKHVLMDQRFELIMVNQLVASGWQLERQNYSAAMSSDDGSTERERSNSYLFSRPKPAETVEKSIEVPDKIDGRNVELTLVRRPSHTGREIRLVKLQSVGTATSLMPSLYAPYWIPVPKTDEEDPLIDLSWKDKTLTVVLKMPNGQVNEYAYRYLDEQWELRLVKMMVERDNSDGCTERLTVQHVPEEGVSAGVVEQLNCGASEEEVITIPEVRNLRVGWAFHRAGSRIVPVPEWGGLRY